MISYECKFDSFKAEYGYNGHEEVETSTDLAGTYIVQVHTQANDYYTIHDSTWFDSRIGYIIQLENISEKRDKDYPK